MMKIMKLVKYKHLPVNLKTGNQKKQNKNLKYKLEDQIEEKLEDKISLKSLNKIDCQVTNN